MRRLIAAAMLACVIPATAYGQAWSDPEAYGRQVQVNRKMAECVRLEDDCEYMEANALLLQQEIDSAKASSEITPQQADDLTSQLTQVVGASNAGSGYADECIRYLGNAREHLEDADECIPEIEFAEDESIRQIWMDQCDDHLSLAAVDMSYARNRHESAVELWNGILDALGLEGGEE